MSLGEDWKTEVGGNGELFTLVSTLDGLKEQVAIGIASCKVRQSSRLGLKLSTSLPAKIIDEFVDWCRSENLAIYLRRSGGAVIDATVTPSA
jgi:hypothetical protein